MINPIERTSEKKTKKFKVLILMASFNGAAWIEEQIISILNQKNVDIDLVIGDDYSKDFTLEIIRRYAKLNKNIKYIRRPKSFGSSGKNFINLFTLVNVEKYDYISLADQDDIWILNKISKAIKSIKKENYSGYSSSVLAFWPNKKQKLITQLHKIKMSDFLFEGAGQGCTFVLPKNIFERIQEFCIKYKKDIDNFYYHDWLVYLLVRSWDHKWFFDQSPSMYYRQHQNNDTGSRGTLLSITKRVEKIRSGWYKNQISIALKIYFLATNHKNNLIMRFSKIFNEKDSISRRLLITKFVWLHGRRRLSDRIVMVVASILGYI